MKTEILLNDLSLNEPITVQKRAMGLLVNINENEVIKLVQPNGKDCWQNAAIVLREIGYPRIKPILYDLLKWLQDLNWPGALEIIELLGTVPKDVLMTYVENVISEAIIEDDDLWLFGIKYFTFECNIGKEDFISKKNYNAIKVIEL